MDKKIEKTEYYDYAELLSSEANNLEDKSIENKNKEKGPEEIELSDFLNMLKRSAETDNEKARRDIYMLTDLIEKDEINFWKLSPRDVGDLLQYAGYTEVDDMVKAFNNIHSRKKFDKFMEERRKNSILGRLKAKVCRIISPKKNEAVQDEQKG